VRGVGRGPDEEEGGAVGEARIRKLVVVRPVRPDVAGPSRRAAEARCNSSCPAESRPSTSSLARCPPCRQARWWREGHGRRVGLAEVGRELALVPLSVWSVSRRRRRWPLADARIEESSSSGVGPSRR